MTPLDYSLRQLMWMTECKQRNEWNQTLALVATINGLFAKKEDRFDIRKLIPKCVIGDEKKEAKAEETPEMAKANLAAIRAAFKGGMIRRA